MKRRRVAIVGLGKLGKACAHALRQDEELVLAGIVRRPERINEKLPVTLGNIPVVAHVSELQAVDVALVCVPAEHVAGVAHDLMSLLRSLFALLIPKGATEVTRRPGVSLHHTALADTISGVKGALSTELHTAAGARQRYVYVELEDGTDLRQVEEAIRNDPLFLGEETMIFQVDSVATLEEDGHGVVVERRGSAGETGHHSILMEARFSEPALSAQIMLGGARAVAACRPGAYSLFDLSPRLLWGEWRAQAENDWL
jgi:diaminopimelate dehydrogenase